MNGYDMPTMIMADMWRDKLSSLLLICRTKISVLNLEPVKYKKYSSDNSTTLNFSEILLNQVYSNYNFRFIRCSRQFLSVIGSLFPSVTVVTHPRIFVLSNRVRALVRANFIGSYIQILYVVRSRQSRQSPFPSVTVSVSHQRILVLSNKVRILVKGKFHRFLS